MSTRDWRWKISEAVERIRTRYEFILRKTGAPFLAVVYPPEVETVVLKEWRTQCATLQPEIDVRPIDVLAETQKVIVEIGAGNIVAARRIRCQDRTHAVNLAASGSPPLLVPLRGRWRKQGRASQRSVWNEWPPCILRPVPATSCNGFGTVPSLHSMDRSSS